VFEERRDRERAAVSVQGMSASPAGSNGRADAASQRPRLVFFHSRASGRSRRVEGYLSQVLQRRRNHESFELYNVDVDKHADLAERFAVSDVPTLVVVEDKRVRARLEAPRGCRDIQRLLAPWLR
jgi:thioredoxin-like negative regulator of GroEL